MYKTSELFDLTKSAAGGYLAKFEYPWQALAGLKEEILRIGNALDKNEYAEVSAGVWVHKSAKIAPTAYLGAPCIVGESSEVRHCAFIRGAALVGKNCVVGNSAELKNAVLFDGAQVPHFNYVGDSVLGYKSHLGAGAVTSNVKSDKTPVAMKRGEETMQTGLKKAGAFVGDFAEIGCNAVLNPGTIIGRNATVYPLSRVRGTVEENCIFKAEGNIVKKRRAGV